MSTVKLIALTLLNDENDGISLTMMANMQADIGTFRHITDAAGLVAMFDDDVAALDRQLMH